MYFLTPLEKKEICQVRLQKNYRDVPERYGEQRDNNNDDNDHKRLCG